MLPLELVADDIRHDVAFDVLILLTSSHSKGRGRKPIDIASCGGSVTRDASSETATILRRESLWLERHLGRMSVRLDLRIELRPRFALRHQRTLARSARDAR